MIDLISDKDIAGLNNHAFRAILNALLTAEADLRRVALGNLDLSLRDTDPDAGIDGRIVWPEEPPHDFLHPGTIAVQYKSGKLAKGEITKEFNKKGVQDNLVAVDRLVGRYILLVARAYPAASREKHREELEGLCRGRHIDPGHCTIVYGDQIARWISRFPSVVIRPELGKGLPAFITVQQWQQQSNFQNPFKQDPDRGKIIKQLQSFASSTSDANVYRVEGQAGVGKTRLVLEALKVDGLAQRSLYCINAGGEQALQMLTSLQASPHATAVIVMDECDHDRQQMVRAFADAACGRLRLICVGPAEKILATPIPLGEFSQLKPLPDELIRAILIDFEPGAPREIVDIAVRLSGGMPKLAIFITSILVKQRSLRLTDLIEIPNVGSFLKRFVKGEHFDVLKGLSLLGKVGWGGDLRVEAESIAEKVLHLPFDRMQNIVKILRDQGVVLSLGNYVYVSPDLLAISAAACLWDERGAELIDIISELPGQAPRRELLRRIAVMGDFPSVRQAIERLLSTEGPYKSIDDLDQEFRSEIFQYLAAAVPREAQQALDRVFRNTTHERLLDFKTGRRHILWTLEPLLRWPETSMAAGRLVCRLALTENETISNNATGIFQQYFLAFLSGSPVPLEERLQLVSELLMTNETPKRLLAVKGASAALAFHEVRMGGDIDTLSQRRFPDEWKPKTWGELWDARRVAISQLSSISEGSDEAATQAREALYHSTFTLLRHGQAGDAVDVLRDHPPKNDKDARQVIDSAKRLLSEASEVIGSEKKKTLEQVVANAFGSSYFDRLRRWVGPRTHADYDAAGAAGFQSADRKAAELAEEGFAKGISDHELLWLASSDAENVWTFGNRLGELDWSKLLLPRIVSATPADLNCVLLSSYLTGIARNRGIAEAEEILDNLANANPTLAFMATWRLGPSEKAGARIIRLMESDQIDSMLYRVFQYGTWADSLPLKIVTRVVELMLAANPAVANEPAVTMLESLIKAHPDTLADVESLVWRALELAPVSQSTNANWRWGQLAGRVAEKEPQKAANLALDRLERDSNPHISGDPVIEVLSRATSADPEAVWQQVGMCLLRSDTFGFQLLLSLEKWYGERIPAASLIRWAQQHQPDGPRIVARLIVTGAPLSERARELISAFPEDDRIWNILASNLQSGGFWGPISGHLERCLQTVRQWEEDSDPRIKTWAQRLAASLIRQIRDQKLSEEGEEL